jgi:Na+-driven multidrug efflux pump
VDQHRLLLALGDTTGLAAGDQTAMGPNGVFLAMMIAFSTLAVVSALIFRQGGWKLQRV